MKQKKFIWSVTMMLLCLLTACAENGASSDDRKENESYGVLADAPSKALSAKRIWAKEILTKALPDRLIQPSVFRLSVSNFFMKNNAQKQQMTLLFLSRDSIIRL